MANPPSGQQFEISAGDQRATIVEVGGGIREYRVGARDVLQPYPAEAMCDGAHGAPLIPWPNRPTPSKPVPASSGSSQVTPRPRHGEHA